MGGGFLRKIGRPELFIMVLVDKNLKIRSVKNRGPWTVLIPTGNFSTESAPLCIFSLSMVTRKGGRGILVEVGSYSTVRGVARYYMMII